MTTEELTELEYQYLLWARDGTPGFSPPAFIKTLMKEHEQVHRSAEMNLCPACIRDRPAG